MFIVKRLSSLDQNEFKDITALIECCRVHDNITNICFLENELNAYENLKCFNLAYSRDKLIGAVTIFTAGDETAEIYAYTHPEYRKEGVFTELLAPAMKELVDYGISEIYFVCDPCSRTAAAIRKKEGFSLSHSEFLMSFNKDYVICPKHSLSLSVSKDDCEYETYLVKNKIGGCNAAIFSKSITIYDFYIVEKYRGRGFGTETLLLVLEYFKKKYADYSIVLHLSGSNIAATSLYTHNGFSIANQIDYLNAKLQKKVNETPLENKKVLQLK